jgi:hypothetical protein
VALTSTSVIVAYRDSDTFGKAIILSISGTVVTVPGSEANFGGVVSAVTGTGLARLSATRAIVSYGDGGTSAACTLDVSGSTITPGTPQGTTESGTLTSICALDSATAIMAYSPFSSVMRAITITNITTTFSYGTSVEINANTFDNIPGVSFISKLDSSRFVITWQESSGSFETRVIVGSHSSGILTFGSDISAITGSSSYTAFPVVVSVKSDGSQAIISASAYNPTAEGAAMSVTIAGTGLTDNSDEIIYDTNDTSYQSIAALKTVGS